MGKSTKLVARSTLTGDLEQWNSLLTRFMRNGDKSQSNHISVGLFQIIDITWPSFKLAASIGHNKLTPIVA